MSINYNCLRAQHPLLDVAQRFLKKLKKIGAHHFAECPFHDDNTPSLCLYTNRSLEEQKFYCFSCQKGGDSLDLLEYFTGEKVFPGTSSSVKEIAQKPKEVPVDRIPSPDEIPGSTEFDPMLITHMESELWASPEAQKALSYALSRFSPNTIKAFRLGFLSRKLKANFKLANFKFADDRLIFPFLSKDQRLVGLIGRDITDSHECKYIFSKGFQKRFFLYGENLFEKYQKVSYSTLFLVEGPTDVLACFEHGFSALATCGTAINFVLVKNWLKKLALMNSLKRFNICFDGDIPGRMAAIELSKYLKENPANWMFNIDLRKMTLSNQQDPYTFLKKGLSYRHSFLSECYYSRNVEDSRAAAEA